MEAFEFAEEDERTECVSANLTLKYDKSSTPNPAYEPNIQLKEIGCPQGSDKDDVIHDQHDHNISCSVPSIDDSASNAIYRFDDASLFSPTCDIQQPQFFANSLMQGNIYQSEATTLIPQVTSANERQSNWTSHQSSSCDDSVDEMSDDDINMDENTKSVADVSEDGQVVDGSIYNRFSINWKMGDRNTAVVHPDFVVYHGRHRADAMLIFSATCIELKTSAAYGHEEAIRWEITDIVDMKIHFADRLEIVMIKLHMISKDANQADNEHQTPGIEEIIFAVDDSKWHKKQEEIASLDDKYKDLLHFVNDGEPLIGGSFAYDPKKNYFPSFDSPFQEVIYPKGEPDAVSVSKRDFDLLQPDIFVNDTIIDFYIKYVKNKIQPGQRHRFHFFNSFFFRKLIDLDKDPASAFKSAAAFQRVRKWTRKVNIFEKDYIFIPINFSYHWSLIIICHPGDVVKSQEKDAENCQRLPCILHMDSMKGTHNGLKNIVQSYLWEEWKERQKESSEDISSKFLNLRFVPLEVPQQQNSFDCGLFLLHYAECFVDDAPDSFNPFRITKLSNFLNMDWFPPVEASLKRGSIQRLIHDMLKVETSETNNGSTNGDAFPLELNCQGNVSSCPKDLGIEITLLPERTTQCGIGDSGLVLRELLVTENATTSYVKGNSPIFDQEASTGGFISPVQINEPDVGANEHFFCTSLNGNDVKLSMVLPEEPCFLSFPSRQLDSNDLLVQAESHSLALEQIDKPNSSNHSTIPNDTLQIAAPNYGEQIGNNNVVGCFTSFSNDPFGWSYGVGKSTFDDYSILEPDGNQTANGSTTTAEESLYNLDHSAYLGSNEKLAHKTNVYEPMFELITVDPVENNNSTIIPVQEMNKLQDGENSTIIPVQEMNKLQDGENSTIIPVQEMNKLQDGENSTIIPVQEMNKLQDGENSTIIPVQEMNKLQDGENSTIIPVQEMNKLQDGENSTIIPVQEMNKLQDGENSTIIPVQEMNKLQDGENSTLPSKRTADDSMVEHSEISAGGEALLEFISIKPEAKRLRLTPHLHEDNCTDDIASELV
ncbi:probable ubiquitin-like-specific protease 2B isoform X2 [Impatiens glandulifera]|uniref:probable ubiquitin-like-specific protease 2B isoform X2 n=1 Tax=Impatiens glandulifera TaxID=253017 RepID=UPI001FB06BF6|nr:probable ubiquitin-like-specific protease 2B isoform X2 [Impatiens glandulifera]